MDFYESYAEYYDILSGDITEDLRFYLDESRKTGKRVLELGCGTGRVLLHLMDNGVDARGIDTSEKMLAVLKEKADHGKLKPQVSVQDMRNFAFKEKFGLIIIPFRAFLHILTPEDQLQTMKCVHRHLEPGGGFIFSIFNPNLRMIVDAEGEKVLVQQIQKGDRRYLRWESRRYDTFNQRMNHLFTVEEFDEKGNLARTITTPFTARYSYRFEIQHLLNLAGFNKLTLYGGFNYEPFGPGSQEMVWVAERE